MSRFLKYINESIDKLDIPSEQVVNLIKQNCSQYLKECNYGKYMLTRKMHIISDIPQLIVPLKDRKPRDTHPDIQIALDDAFEKKFGIRLRSESTFCVLNNRSDRGLYGETFIIFPYNNYKLFYNPYINDLFLAVPGKDETKEYIDKFKQNNGINKLVNDYKQIKLSVIGKEFGKWKTGHEIMLICSKYIALPIYEKETINILDMLNIYF